MSACVSQIDLVVAIGKALAKLGYESSEPRHMNAIIEAANIIRREFNRESVAAVDGMGLAAWLQSDDTGLSSKWMAHICAGGPSTLFGYPYDPGDFGRCYRFLRAVPEARDNFYKLKECGAVWAAFVDNWKEMELLYEEEFPTGSAPKLYRLMQSIRAANE